MKTITSNSRADNQVSLLHLFEFSLVPLFEEITGDTNTEMITSIYANVLTREPDAEGLAHWVAYWDDNPTLTKYDMRDIITRGAIANDDFGLEKLYLTDHDIFVNYSGNQYTPLSISFDKLKEDISTQSNEINLTLDNISGDLAHKAFQYEWRGNPVSIKRVVYTPPSESPIDGNTYEFGYGDNLEGVYPELLLDDVLSKDIYSLFDGYINSFSASESSLSASVSTKFIYWQRAYPSRTYDQKEFSGIIQAMSEEQHWGRI